MTLLLVVNLLAGLSWSLLEQPLNKTPTGTAVTLGCTAATDGLLGALLAIDAALEDETLLPALGALLLWDLFSDL